MSTVLMLPRHRVVRILAHGTNCRRLAHAKGWRVVVRWTDEPAGYEDIDEA